MASSQLMLSPRATCGKSSVNSMAYQALLPPRTCSKAWAHHLWVYNGTQYETTRDADVQCPGIPFRPLARQGTVTATDYTAAGTADCARTNDAISSVESTLA